MAFMFNSLREWFAETLSNAFGNPSVNDLYINIIFFFVNIGKPSFIS